MLCFCSSLYALSCQPGHHLDASSGCPKGCFAGADSSTLAVVKGSGSITSRAVMIDYTKNLTVRNTPIYGNVQYIFDAIGDTQGRGNLPPATM